MGLDVDHSTPNSSPFIEAPLTKDLDGDPCSGYFSFASIVGMLIYLDVHSRPDISHIVSQVASFTLCTKRSHESGLKFIGRYLLVKKNRSTCEEK